MLGGEQIQPLNHFRDFSTESLWRLFIDFNRQRDIATEDQVSPDGFDEREPGYLKSLFHAFDDMLQNINEPLSLDSIIRSHDLAISFTIERLIMDTPNGYEPYYQEFEKGLRYDDVCSLGLVTQGPMCNCTRKGLQELLEKIIRQEVLVDITYFESVGSAIQHITKLPISDNELDSLFQLATEGKLQLEQPIDKLDVIQHKMNTVIASYNREIDLATTEDKKLSLIANVIQIFDLIHPFTDANARTFVLMQLNKLLIKSGFSPAILVNPNITAALSNAELVQEIKQGMHRFQTLQLAEQESTIYLKGNPMIAQLFVNEAVRDIPGWDKVNVQDRGRAIKLVVDSLMNINQERLHLPEQQKLKEVIQGKLAKAVYTPSRGIGMFAPAGGTAARIWFETDRSVYNVLPAATQRDALEVSKLSSELNHSLVKYRPKL